MFHRIRLAPRWACLWACLLGLAAGLKAADSPSVVKLNKSDKGYELSFDGQPFFVKGAGGKYRLDELARRGGNSIRTWGVDNIDDILADAQKNGLKVTIGFWLGHKRHGFNYSDADAVKRQLENCRKGILKYRNHPALLMWAAGNEMEQGDDNQALWRAVNDVAKLCKELDPNHPVMTVVAELGGEKVKHIHEYCPDVDILGINTYGGVQSIGKRYLADGGVKPYIVTEFGPPGTWEIPAKPWGAPPEFNSTKKAKWYADGYRDGILAHPGFCLGSYAFIWGWKQEGTATWYGMWLKDGSRLGVVEAMSKLWGGQPFENRCPEIGDVTLSKEQNLKGGEVLAAEVQASDPDGDPLQYKWVLCRDSGLYNTGGDDQPDQPEFPDAVQGTGAKASVTVPGGGKYRLFCYVYDGKGNAAVANAPCKADGKETPPPTPKVQVPFTVYADGQASQPWIPSGYMGNTGALALDPNCEERPASGKTCLKVEYRDGGQWGGVVWQSPPNDWGKLPGGYDLSAANVLVFKARGAKGGEKVTFGAGIIQNDQPYPDSVRASLKEQLLQADWQDYRLPLSGADLSHLKSGFYFSLGGQGQPVTFFLDDIKYIHDPQAAAAKPAAQVAPAAKPAAQEGAAPAGKALKSVYGDDIGDWPWIPAGFMGNTGAIAMDDKCTDAPHSGRTCLKVEYRDGGQWGGVVWQSPANDWGQQPGGYDLAGAATLEFWVRGEQGGEKVSFGFGLLKKDAKTAYADSGRGQLKDVVLGSDWQCLRIPLAGKDLSCIKTGFYWTLGGQGRPVAFYLDDIRYVAAAK